MAFKRDLMPVKIQNAMEISEIPIKTVRSREWLSPKMRATIC